MKSTYLISSSYQYIELLWALTCDQCAASFDFAFSNPDFRFSIFVISLWTAVGLWSRDFIATLSCSIPNLCMSVNQDPLRIRFASEYLHLQLDAVNVHEIVRSVRLSLFSGIS